MQSPTGDSSDIRDDGICFLLLAIVVRMYIRTQILVGMIVLRRAVAKVMDILHVAVVDEIAYIVEEIFVGFGSHAEYRMILAIVSLDILEEAIVVLAEVLVARC